MNNWIVGIIALVVVVFLIKKGCKPAVSVFILSTAAIAIFLFDKLVTVQPFWLVAAGLLWLLVAIAVLKTARENGRYVIPFLLIALVAISGVAYAAPKFATDQEQVPVEAEANQEAKVDTTTLASFNPDFVQVASDNTGNKVDATWEKGLADNLFSSGNNYDEAFRLLVLQRTSSNAHLFAVWANAAGLYGDPNNWQPLVEGDKLSPEAQKLWWQFAGMVKTAKAKQTQASANGVNTGVSSGVYGAANDAGISGNLAASQLDFANGDSLVVLERCGNFVLPSKPPGLPTVPTDNPPPAKGGPPVNPPSPPTPPGVTPKDPSQDPYPQGNAPEGGGTNIDPGAGEYIAPEAMPVVPETPYVPPAPPPAPPSAPPIDSTPDPYVPPAPEPEAPTREEPATGVVPVPGM